MASLNQKPPMDPELRAALGKLEFPAISNLNPEILKMMRTATATPLSYLEAQKARGISHQEVRIPSKDGTGHEILLSILQPTSDSQKLRPCIYWMHGGAFHWGDRLHTLEFPTDVILECDAICVTVEYRLAPEHSFSAALEDCYQGLQWVSNHVQKLGIDPKRIMVGGISAGGGLAASTVILCRDRQGPVVCAQCLICPSLDDRLVTVSSQQFLEVSDILPRSVFKDVLGGSYFKNDQQGSNSGITIAGKVENLSALPTTYLDAGSAEILRDETVAYASRLWATGIQAELHIWAGGFHGFDIFLPDIAVSQASRKAKLSWAKRVFGVENL